MKNKTLTGIILSSLLFIVGFCLHGNLGLYFNTSGLLIVFGGTLAAAFISFRFEQLRTAFSMLKNAYRTPAGKTGLFPDSGRYQPNPSGPVVSHHFL